MDQLKILSGAELVAKGVTKLDASLPEGGLKDVVPNGSWLEEKQIQSAIEARKHLLDVERIEKVGSISHAVWRDDLKLAEVTKMAGSHWQYVGHNVGKTKLLYPEEALLLMELNSLLLTHNEVIVSLQKAYSLLLDTTTTLTQYKVYSSLCRLGYKMLRHKGPKLENSKPPETVTEADQNIEIDTSTATKDPKKENVENDSNNDDKHSELNVTKEKEKTNELPLPMEIDKTNETISSNEVHITNTEANVADSNAQSETICTLDAIETNSSEAFNKSLEEPTEIENSSQDTDRIEAHIKSSETMDTDIQVPEGNVNHDNATEPVTSTESNCNEGIEENPENHKLEVIQIDDESTQESVIMPTTCESDADIDCYITRSKIFNRNLKPCDSNSLNKNFENIPDLFKKQVITINVPNEELIPKNIFVNKSTYTLNVPNIKKKTMRSMSNEYAYTSTDVANGSHIRRIRSSSSTEFPQYQLLPPPGHPNMRPQRPNHFFRPFWRPQNNINYFQFSMFFQRPTYHNMFLQSRFQYHQRPNTFDRPLSYANALNPNLSNCENNKRTRSGRNTHLRNIKTLAQRLKHLVQAGNPQIQSIAALKSLLHSYNYRYKSKLRLNESFDIVDDETVLETIELDDEEESRSKRPRIEVDDDLFKENLAKLNQFATKLKELEDRNQATARHRRAFSTAIKTFNNSFNADVYLNDEYKVIDNRHINLDTSSESETVVEHTKKPRKGKKLRNPFNILKRMSQKFDLKVDSITDNGEAPGVSEVKVNDVIEHANSNNNEEVTTHDRHDTKYNDFTTKVFDKNWLPNENDFGRAEIVPKSMMNSRIIDSNKEIFLYDFMNEQYQEYDNWLEAKSCFIRHIEETNIAIQNRQKELLAQSDLTASELKPIIDTEDCSNMPLVLEKLRIIEYDKQISTESDLRIDFDVYNRNVQNFKKTNPPTPHFRVICVDESSSFPSATEIRSLLSKYDDDVSTVFAIVGTGSISYLQINPMEMPIYVPNSDLT